MEHRAIRQGDEMYCPVCRLRWGVDEEVPNAECVKSSSKRVTPAHWKALREWMEDEFQEDKKPQLLRDLPSSNT